MKRHIYICSIVVCIMSLFHSCLKDEDEIFDQSASHRMQAALNEYRDILQDSQYGWLMEYYPDSKQSYGGYNYVLSFTDKNVTVGSEITDPTETETSLYQLISDNGPILTFNTYNTIMHYFATPYGSSSLYQGRGGDYEFMFVDVSDDLITLKGKKTGNKIMMYKLTEPKTSYLEKIAEMADLIITDGFTTTIGSVKPDISFGDHVMTFIYPGVGEEVNIIIGAFIYTPTGIKFYEPIEIGGKKFQNMRWNDSARTLVCTDEGETDIVLTANELPVDYVKYNEFIGSWTMNYSSGPKDITIEMLEKNKSLLLKGLNPNFNIQLTFNKTTGTVQILSQIVEQVGGNDIWFCPWDSNEGYLTWDTKVGMISAKDMEDTGLKIDFKDNGAWRSYVVRSFILRYFPGGTTSNGGNYTSWGDHRYVGSFSMVKNN